MARNTLATLNFIAWILLCGCGAPNETVQVGDLLSEDLVDANGKTVQTNPATGTNDYLLLYFSAHWCPPCQAFTPQLVDFYNANGGGRLFQVVLISNDHNEQAMYRYMSETRMPWPAVRFRSDSARTLDSIYSGDGIPRLVLLGRQGEVVADSFKGSEYIGPRHVLDKLGELLSRDQPVPTLPAKTQDSSFGKKLARTYKLQGLGKGSEGRCAIINELLVSEGVDLDEGLIVEKITSTHVEVSFEGNRYRLYPPSLQKPDEAN